VILTLTLTLKSTQSDDMVKYETEDTVSAEENVKCSQMCQFLDLNIAVLGMIMNKNTVQWIFNRPKPLIRGHLRH
jgi:hypothetical protein